MNAMNAEARLQTIAPLWAWLPAFRVVAETEHLPTAARVLGVTASTLSRSIAALERAVGKPLFARTGRSLRLDANGRVLLAAVRDAMRWIEDGVVSLAGQGYRGDFLVASGGAGTTAFVTPKLAEMRRRHPELVPHVVSPDHARTPQDLLRGRLDVAFQETEATAAGLVTVAVAEIGRGVYCGREHPLFGRRRVHLDDLRGAEFVAAPGDATRESIDGWPASVPRTIAMVVDQVRVGLEVCVSLPLLAVLPDVLAAEREGALRRLPVDLIPPGRLYAIYRRPLGKKPNPTTELVSMFGTDVPGVGDSS